MIIVDIMIIFTCDESRWEFCAYFYKYFTIFFLIPMAANYQSIRFCKCFSYTRTNARAMFSILLRVESHDTCVEITRPHIF